LLKIDASDKITRGFFKNAIDGIVNIEGIFRDLERTPRHEVKQRFHYYMRGSIAEIETNSAMTKLRDRIFKQGKFQNNETYTIGKIFLEKTSF